MASHVEPNKWYFAVDCSKCGEAIPFAEAPSPGEEPEPQFRTIKLQCPHCGTEDVYAPALMTRRQGLKVKKFGKAYSSKRLSRVSLSETQSCWQLISNRAML